MTRKNTMKFCIPVINIEPELGYTLVFDFVVLLINLIHRDASGCEGMGKHLYDNLSVSLGVLIGVNHRWKLAPNSLPPNFPNQGVR